METLILIVFWVPILLCIASYFIYPLTIHVIGRISAFKYIKKNITPRVSVIIAAYNEEKSIEKKILNTLESNYPGDKIEILIGSDGSTDRTARICEQYDEKNIFFFNFSENRGKTSVQNDLAKNANGEILIFTDAASFIPANSIKKLVENFVDERVGCVAGKMQFVGTNQNLNTQGQGLYWRYESYLREIESSIGRLIGVDGPLYAVRRECYVPLAANIISDLMTPILVLKQGRRVVLEPEALVNEVPTQQTEQEFRTRRRIALRGLVGIFSQKELLNPFQFPFLFFQIIFHKLIRWMVGILVMLNGAACAALADHGFYQFYLLCYIFFFLSAIAGWLAGKNSKIVKYLKVPYYFTLVNLAATAGVVDFIMKKQAVSWKPVRE